MCDTPNEYIDDWKHNDYGVFDTELLAIESVKDKTAQYVLFYYEMYEKELTLPFRIRLRKATLYGALAAAVSLIAGLFLKWRMKAVEFSVTNICIKAIGIGCRYRGLGAVPVLEVGQRLGQSAGREGMGRNDEGEGLP